MEIAIQVQIQIASQAIVEAKAIEIWKMNREARNEKWRKTDTTTTANATARRGHNI